jgi:hypothetical protein
MTMPEDPDDTVRRIVRMFGDQLDRETTSDERGA